MVRSDFAHGTAQCLVQNRPVGGTGSLLSRLKFSGHFSEDGTGGDPLGNRRGTGRSQVGQVVQVAFWSPISGGSRSVKVKRALDQRIPLARVLLAGKRTH